MPWCSKVRLPSTGATTHANYQNGVISNTYSFNPNWVGTFTFGTSYLHGTADRNGYLGFALAFPFSSTSKTISGFETYGDNQFVTPDYCVPGHSQSGKISVPLRFERFRWPARSQVRHRLHPRTGTQWRIPGSGGNAVCFDPEPDLLSDESWTAPRRSRTAFRPSTAQIVKPPLRQRGTAIFHRMCSAWVCTPWTSGVSLRS